MIFGLSLSFGLPLGQLPLPVRARADLVRPGAAAPRLHQPEGGGQVLDGVGVVVRLVRRERERPSSGFRLLKKEILSK